MLISEALKYHAHTGDSKILAACMVSFRWKLVKIRVHVLVRCDSVREDSVSSSTLPVSRPCMTLASGILERLAAQLSRLHNQFLMRSTVCIAAFGQDLLPIIPKDSNNEKNSTI
jgi:hypothetical protein